MRATQPERKLEGGRDVLAGGMQDEGEEGSTLLSEQGMHQAIHKP